MYISYLLLITEERSRYQHDNISLKSYVCCISFECIGVIGLLVKDIVFALCMELKSLDTKGIIRRRKSKDIQYNDQTGQRDKQ